MRIEFCSQRLQSHFKSCLVTSETAVDEKQPARSARLRATPQVPPLRRAWPCASGDVTVCEDLLPPPAGYGFVAVRGGRYLRA